MFTTESKFTSAKADILNYYDWGEGMWHGLTSGAAQLAMVMIWSEIAGRDWTWWPTLVGQVFHPYEKQPNFSLVITGLFVHLLLSMFVAVLYVIMITRVSRRLIRNRPLNTPILCATGVGFGLIVWLVNYFSLLNITNPTMGALVDPGQFLLAHLSFGALLGLLCSRNLTHP